MAPFGQGVATPMLENPLRYVSVHGDKKVSTHDKKRLM